MVVFILRTSSEQGFKVKSGVSNLFEADFQFSNLKVDVVLCLDIHEMLMKFNLWNGAIHGVVFRS